MVRHACSTSKVAFLRAIQRTNGADGRAHDHTPVVGWRGVGGGVLLGPGLCRPDGRRRGTRGWRRSGDGRGEGPGAAVSLRMCHRRQAF